MKKLATLAALLLALWQAAAAQEFVGTMTYGDYTMENIRATLVQRNGRAELTMYRVKFSRMMPVKLDVTISDIEVHGDSLYAARVIPTVKGKPYDKWPVTQLQGRLGRTEAYGTAMMNGKRFSYKGKRQAK